MQWATLRLCSELTPCVLKPCQTEGLAQWTTGDTRFEDAHLSRKKIKLTMDWLSRPVSETLFSAETILAFAVRCRVPRRSGVRHAGGLS